MKKLIIPLMIIFCFFYSCKKTNVKISENLEKKVVEDTLINTSTVIIVMPNQNEILKLKNKYGEEDFYTIADDASYYMAKIKSKIKKRNIVFCSKKTYHFDKQNLEITKNDFKDPWFIIDYNNGKALKYSLVDYYSNLSNENLNPSEKKKLVTTYENNEDYFIINIDVNNDGLLDKIVSSKPYKGNLLYFFCKKNNDYKLALESLNFSEDGGNIIKTISLSETDKETIVLHTYFPDGGNFQAFHHIKYEGNNSWKLSETVYEKTDWQDSKTYICDVKQDINMKDFTTKKGFNNFNIIPENVSIDKMCKVKN